MRPKAKPLFYLLPAFTLLALHAAGFRLVVPLTDSMEPVIPPGSLVLVAPAWLREPGVGDVALFRAAGVLVLHRVVAVEDGRLVTRGDARGFNDPWRVERGDVLGAAVLSIPLAGYALLLLRPLAPPLVFLASFQAFRRALGGWEP